MVSCVVEKVWSEGVGSAISSPPAHGNIIDSSRKHDQSELVVSSMDHEVKMLVDTNNCGPVSGDNNNTSSPKNNSNNVKKKSMLKKTKGKTKKKRLQFVPEEQMKELFEYECWHTDPDLMEQIWYTRGEFFQIRQQNKKTVSKFKKGKLTENNKNTLRGLEHLDKTAFYNRLDVRDRAFRAVMAKQIHYWQILDKYLIIQQQYHYQQQQQEQQQQQMQQQQQLVQDQQQQEQKSDDEDKKSKKDKKKKDSKKRDSDDEKEIMMGGVGVVQDQYQMLHPPPEMSLQEVEMKLGTIQMEAMMAIAAAYSQNGAVQCHEKANKIGNDDYDRAVQCWKDASMSGGQGGYLSSDDDCSVASADSSDSIIRIKNKLKKSGKMLKKGVGKVNKMVFRKGRKKKRTDNEQDNNNKDSNKAKDAGDDNNSVVTPPNGDLNANQEQKEQVITMNDTLHEVSISLPPSHNRPSAGSAGSGAIYNGYFNDDDDDDDVGGLHQKNSGDSEEESLTNMYDKMGMAHDTMMDEDSTEEDYDIPANIIFTDGGGPDVTEGIDDDLDGGVGAEFKSEF